MSTFQGREDPHTPLFRGKVHYNLLPSNEKVHFFKLTTLLLRNPGYGPGTKKEQVLPVGKGLWARWGVHKNLEPSDGGL